MPQRKLLLQIARASIFVCCAITLRTVRTIFMEMRLLEKSAGFVNQLFPARDD